MQATLLMEVISAVFSSMMDAEQYFSCDSLMARSTRLGFRFLPRM
jgi:hypothetical protein